MDISVYFEPIDSVAYQTEEFPLGSRVVFYSQVGKFPEIEGAELAIFGVHEDRNAVNNEGCAQAPDFIRNKLYLLHLVSENPKIVDLGNIKAGHSAADTYFAVSSVLSELLRKNIVPIILGGGQDITYAQYTAYQMLEQTVNIVSVDATFNIGAIHQDLDSNSYLGKIITHEPSFLFNYSNIGYQTYFVGADSVELMSKLFFDTYRLGYVRANLEEVEPIVRNADMLSFDVSSIRQSDAPGNKNASPNGFYGEEACQIARYAGMSDKLSSIGFYEINPKYDRGNQTSHLVAQMIWYFMDGFYNRKKDFPLSSKQGFVKYRVAIKNTEHEIIFYKSKKSDRWWMEVPYQDYKTKYYRHHIIPCSYQDYQTACNEEMPERWWLGFQKLS